MLAAPPNPTHGEADHRARRPHVTWGMTVGRDVPICPRCPLSLGEGLAYTVGAETPVAADASAMGH